MLKSVVVVREPRRLSFPTRRLDKLYWGDLDGRTWTRWSISIWDIVKSPSEQRLGHPAMFPVELCERLIRVYSRVGDVVLDPFMGSGSTLVAARRLSRHGVGFEIYDYFIDAAVRRLNDVGASMETFLSGVDISPLTYIVQDDARNLDKYLDKESVDMVLTSPPYFNVHNRRRTSDKKEPRPYGDDPRDLGNIDDYGKFLKELRAMFEKMHYVMRSGGVAVVVVMDVREDQNFYPLHMDVAEIMRDVGFSIRDIIIWDRGREYNNLRPIGYPHKFIVNKIHEYIMIFEKL